MKKFGSLWKLALAVLPLAAAYNAGAGRFGNINGVYQKLPFSAMDALTGFFIGLICSGILYGIGVGVLCVIKKMKTKSNSN